MVTTPPEVKNWGPVEWAQAYNGMRKAPDDNWGRSEDAVSIMMRLYRHRDETIDDIFRRVAKSVAPKGEGDKVYKALCLGNFAFSTPIMMNAVPNRPFFSAACYILPIEDSLESITETMKVMARVYSRAGGVGINLSPLRGKGQPVKGTGGKAGGPVSFLHAFQGLGKALYSGGRARKAAMLATLDADHPDIKDFILAKDETDALNEMNLSVRIRNKDIDSLAWQEAVTHAWKCGDPGMIFVDNQDIAMPALLIDELGSCGNNPCAEFCFPPGEHGAACNLGSINLLNHVFYDLTTLGNYKTGEFKIYHEKIVESAKLLFRCLDNVIDKSVYPSPGIKTLMQEYRPCGVGVTGFARMLMLLKIKYGNNQSCQIAENIMELIKSACHSIKCNSVVRTTIAPTGTLSWVVGAEGSFGIEPVFALEMTKRMKDPETGEVKDVKIPIPELEGLGPDCPWAVSANDLTVEEHLKVAAAFQKYNDMSISKTVNLPNSATVADVDKAFRLAHELGLKGLTVYRDGCKNEQVMYSGSGSEPRQTDTKAGGGKTDWTGPRSVSATAGGHSTPDPNFSPKVPGYAEGCVHRIKIGGRALYVHVYRGEKEIQQVFITYDKPGEHITAFTSALGRVISIALQRGVPTRDIISTLRGIYAADGCSFHRFPGEDKPVSIKSVPDAIAAVLSHYEDGSSRDSEVGEEMGKRCPSCGKKTIVKISGCDTCMSPGCGYSSCG